MFGRNLDRYSPGGRAAHQVVERGLPLHKSGLCRESLIRIGGAGGSQLQSCLLFAHSLDEFSIRSLLDFLHFRSHQHRAIGISARTEAAGTLQHGTQSSLPDEFHNCRDEQFLHESKWMRPDHPSRALARMASTSPLLSTPPSPSRHQRVSQHDLLLLAGDLLIVLPSSV